MRYLRVLITFLFLAGISSCKKSGSADLKSLRGAYTGTFEHTPFARPKAQITLSFLGTKYNGSSDQVDYADICNGTYLIEGSNIKFTDQCARTEQFTTAITLNGEYNLERNGNTILISKTYASGSKDIYVLVKQ